MSDVKIGDTFWYLDADVTVVSVGSPDDAFPVRDGEVGHQITASDDADTLGWSPCTNGEYEAVTARAQFLAVAEQTAMEQPGEPFDLANFVDAVTGAPAAEVLAATDAPQGHGPLAAPLSDRTLAKVLSRPAHVPSGTPSLVELDAKEAVLAAVLAWDEAVTLRQGTVQTYTALRAAVREYREVTS